MFIYKRILLGIVSLAVLAGMINFGYLSRVKASDTHKEEVVQIFQDFPAGVTEDFAYSIGYEDKVRNPEYNPNIPLVIPNPLYQPEYILNGEETIPNPDYISPTIPNLNFLSELDTPGQPETIPNPDYQPETIPNPECVPEFIDNPVTNTDYIYYFLKTMIQQKVKDYRQKKVLQEIDKIKSEQLNAIPNVEL